MRAISVPTLLAGMLLLAIFSFSTCFYQQFYMPKLLVFFCIAVLGLAWLTQRRQLYLPDARVLLFIAAFILAGALLGIPSGAPIAGFMQWAYYLGASLLYIVFLQFDRAQFELLLKVLLGAALLQLGLIVVQQANLHGVLPAALIGGHERLYGSVGNQEFLATLLGVGFFVALHFRAHAGDVKHRLLLAIASGALLLGLALAQNKGGLLFVGMYFLWRRYPRRMLLTGLAAAVLVLGVLLFPDSVKGRALLWMAAAAMYLQHALAGVGYLQFENHYLDAVRDLFASHPALSGAFGTHTAMTLDAHNLFLQFGAELGTAGLLLSLAFARHAWRIARADNGYLGAALLFLLFKCLYTVVLPSITGMIVFMLLLAGLAPKRSIKWAGAKRYAGLAATPLLASVFAFAAVPALSDYYYQQGARSLLMAQNASALLNLNQALALDPENADASLALAQAGYLQHDYAGMGGHLQEALRYRKNKDTYKIAASMYYYARRYDEAFELYQRLHEAFPQHLTSLTKLACIYMIRGNFDRAYVMAQQALHATPREEAASDAKNLEIARQVVIDSFPRLSAVFKSN